MALTRIVFCTLPQVIETETGPCRYVDGFEDMGGHLVVGGFELSDADELIGLCPMTTVKTIEDGLVYLDSLIPSDADLAYFASL